jgi:glycine betaine/choline ABC-type transport system substrate-binding protein
MYLVKKYKFLVLMALIGGVQLGFAANDSIEAGKTNLTNAYSTTDELKQLGL